MRDIGSNQEFPTVGHAIIHAKVMVIDAFGENPQALVAHGEAFVLAHPQARAEEAHKDRKRRGLWLKQNKQALGACCKAVISVEPDDARRTELAAQSAMAEKAFGIPMRMVATLEQACADGLALLGADA